MKISEHAGTAAAVSSITVLINIMLNAIFIYGAFGIESMNVRGAALATLISRVVELMLSITFSYRPGYIRLKIRELFARNKELSADFMKCSGPILGASLVWGIGFTSYSTFMGHMGTDAAAANSVAAVVRDIICCLSAGISSAAGIMIGNELGAGNLKRGKAYGIRMAKLSFFVRSCYDSAYGGFSTGDFTFCKAHTAGCRVSEAVIRCTCFLHDWTIGK